jgi:hypothetical protein
MGVAPLILAIEDHLPVDRIELDLIVVVIRVAAAMATRP